MKRKENLKEHFAGVLEIPGDLAYQEPIVTVIGRDQAVVENYRSILRYTREEIVLITLRGKLTICGKCLRIPCYTPWEMQVKGCISKVILH